MSPGATDWPLYGPKGLVIFDHPQTSHWLVVTLSESLVPATRAEGRRMRAAASGRQGCGDGGLHERTSRGGSSAQGLRCRGVRRVGRRGAAAAYWGPAALVSANDSA